MNRPPLKTVKKRITADWAAELPTLGIYKPLWLMKRHGPMLVGVCLDRTSSGDEYRPVVHVHNLLSPFPVVSLSLARDLPGERHPALARRIRTDRHEATFRSAADVAKAMAPYLEARELSLFALLKLYGDAIVDDWDPAIAREPLRLFEDVVRLTFWAGYEAYARACLDAAATVVDGWRKEFVPAAPWKASMLAALDKGRLEAVFAEQMKNHAADKVPAYPLAIDAPPDLDIVDVYSMKQRTLSS